MKFATFAVLAIFVAATAFAASPSNTPMAKEDIVPPVMPDYGRQGGEDIGTAAVIVAIPFSDSGTTVGYLDDYDEVCPYTGSLAPDVVYSYYAAEDICVRISLCNSFYDTKLFVYENVWTPNAPYACNDDASDCEAPPVSFTSNLPEVEFFAGNTYYIVVDGYSSGSGNYVLDITEIDCPTPCVVECPPEGIDEGEGPCYDEYVDMYNGGCNSTPNVFLDVAPSAETITYCGLAGNYSFTGLAYRDTDWYMMDLTCATNTITVCVEAEFNVLVGFVDMSVPCDQASFYSSMVSGTCEPACLTEVLPPGPWVIFVGVSEWADWPCDGDYVLTIDGYESCVPVEDASWGSIKALYR